MANGKKKHVHPILNQEVVKPWGIIPVWDNEPFPILRSSDVVERIKKLDGLEPKFAEQVIAHLPYIPVTVVIVNLNTSQLLNNCLRSLSVAYPGIKAIVVDNGSVDNSVRSIPISDIISVDVIPLPKNIGHGPAMCKAIKQVTSPFFLTMDTDTIVEKPGFIEYMVDWLDSGNKKYAIGWKRLVHRTSGVPADWSRATAGGNLIEYIHPYCGMYKTELYHKLPPFEHHGAPCVSNMCEAVKRGYILKAFPGTNQYHLGDYVKHLTAGTRRMYPIPDWDPKNRKPSEWDPKKVINI